MEALGRVLAQRVISDLDIPPFEKSAMDGFAVRSIDGLRSVATGSLPGVFTARIVGESRAGAPFAGRVGAGECIEITTGAEVPPDCDAVVMIEKTQRESALVHIADQPTPGANVCHRGEDLRLGAPVLEASRRLSAVDLAVLASVGCEPVPCHARPRMALLTTGDELVPPSTRPGAGQIREGNTFYLAARAREVGAEVVNFGVVRDDARELEARFRTVLEGFDIVVTTGGVSMGKYDLVGATFERCGVEPVFHKIAIKPGKPLWFGVHGAVPVFALPGNPVSCLIGFEVFVRPALAKLEGACEDEIQPRLCLGRWRGAATSPNPRQQNLPVRVSQSADGVDELEPIAWTSSADIVGIARAQGLAVVEPGARLDPGALASYRPLGRRS